MKDMGTSSSALTAPSNGEQAAEQVKHTPGPWCVDGEHLRAMVRGADMTIVAVRHRLPRDLNVANMRLIAAAPDLLECLRDLLSACEAEVNEKGGGGFILARMTDARAAIAKATGAS